MAIMKAMSTTVTWTVAIAAMIFIGAHGRNWLAVPPLRLAVPRLRALRLPDARVAPAPRRGLLPS
jgi:hypothetical protein